MSERRVISGRFEVGELVGQGGMGSVYSGIDTHTGESVAIKALKSDIVAQDPGMVARFAREGEALRKLNHPSIVKVLAAFDDNGEHFIVMEYVAGGSLRDTLDEHGTLPIDRVLQIGLDLADALTRAHRLKIIHRDIKPANVLLAEDGTPRLTDFGVARMDDSSRMTTTGAMVGTLAYLSPESCYGLEIDSRSDIWAFGVMLFEMLTGKRPFEADNTAALLTAIISKPHPDIAQLRSDAPPLLVDLINKMLVKERDQRIPSVRLVGAELEAILAGASTSTIEGDWIPSAAHAETGESRFSTPTPSESPLPFEQGDNTPSFTSETSSKVFKGQGETSHHKVAQIVKDESGEKYLVLKRSTTIVGRIIAISVLAILVIAIVLLSARPASAPEDGNTSNNGIFSVSPVEPKQYMVLVAQPEQKGSTTRDVQATIVDDLTQRLTSDVPFSPYRIRAYPAVVKSAGEATTIAESNHAAVVVWGSYDDTGVQLEVQVGDLALFKYMAFSRDDVETMTNVRLRLTDERSQSIALPVLAAFQTLFSFDGDGYAVARNSAVGNFQVNSDKAEVAGNSIAARWSRMVTLFVTGEGEAALEEVNAAIDLYPTNPMLYLARSLIRQQLGDLDIALEDASTAQSLGPENWGTPLLQFANDAFFLRNDIDTAFGYYNQLVEVRPDDPFSYISRGAIYYLQGKFDLAKADLDRAIELDVDVNFPYLFAIGLALREGRLQDAQNLLKTVLARFPDPSSGERILSATLGSTASVNYIAPTLAAFGNLTLRQWSQVIENVNIARERGLEIGDLYLLQGLAYCNLKDYPAAEAAYSKGIELDPDFVTLYALRSEVRYRQNNLTGAFADGAFILNSPLAQSFAPLIPALTSGELSCENFFDADLQALSGEATAEATESP